MIKLDLKHRPMVDHIYIRNAWTKAEQMMTKRRAEKGDHVFVSSHEALGVISEEYHELVEAVHKSDHNEMESELIDLMVAAAFALACLNQGTYDW